MGKEHPEEAKERKPSHRKKVRALLGVSFFYGASKMIQAQWPPLLCLGLLGMAFGFSMLAIWEYKEEESSKGQEHRRENTYVR